MFLGMMLTTKILLVPQKCQIIMVLNKYSFLFLHCFIFGIISLLLCFISLFYSYRSSNYRKSDICRSFTLLQEIVISFPLLFAIAFKTGKFNILLGHPKLFRILPIIFSPTVGIPSFACRRIGISYKNISSSTYHRKYCKITYFCHRF